MRILTDLYNSLANIAKAVFGGEKAANVVQSSPPHQNIPTLTEQLESVTMEHDEPQLAPSSSEANHENHQETTEYRVCLKDELTDLQVEARLEKTAIHAWLFEQQLDQHLESYNQIEQEREQLKQELVSAVDPEEQRNIKHRIKGIEQRMKKLPLPLIPRMELNDENGESVDLEFIQSDTLSTGVIQLHVSHCPIYDHRLINQALLETSGFTDKKELENFKESMRIARSHCCQWKIQDSHSATTQQSDFQAQQQNLEISKKGAKPAAETKKESEDALQLCRSQIDVALNELLQAPQEHKGGIKAIHFLKMQEAVLDSYANHQKTG